MKKQPNKKSQKAKYFSWIMYMILSYAYYSKNIDISYIFFKFHDYCQYWYIVTPLQSMSQTYFHWKNEHTFALTSFLLIISEQINDLISYRQKDVGRKW